MLLFSMSMKLELRVIQGRTLDMVPSSKGRMVKVKVGFLHSAAYTVEPEQRASQSRKWQLIGKSHAVVLRRYAAYPLPALTDIGPAAAASKHTTAPINHTRASLCLFVAQFM